MPARQQTLAATIDWSYALLEPDEQAALKQLAVFAGGFSLAAASAVCGDDEAALRLLSSLRDKSLIVTRSAGDGGARFAMLDTIREYALERLRADGGDAVAYRRFAEHFVEIAERRTRAQRAGAGALAAASGRRLRELRRRARLGPRGGRGRPAAPHLGCARASGSSAATCAKAASGSARRCGSGPSKPTPVLGRALYGGCALAVADGDLETGRSLAVERLRVARALDDDAEVASALGALANAAAMRGEYGGDHALGAGGRARDPRPGVAGAREHDDQPRLPLSCRATPSRHRAMPRGGSPLRRLGIRDEQAGATVNVAIGLLRRGDSAAALGVVSDSLATYAELGHEDGVSYCLDVVAAGVLRRGDARSAGLLAGAADALRANTGAAAPPLEQALHEETLEELRRQLEPEDLAAAFAAGEAVASDEAVVLASGAGRATGPDAFQLETSGLSLNAGRRKPPYSAACDVSSGEEGFEPSTSLTTGANELASSRPWS